jgi:hypothetical protein
VLQSGSKRAPGATARKCLFLPNGGLPLHKLLNAHPLTMTDTFRSDFESARLEFMRNRSTTMAALDIANRSMADLSKQYSELLEQSCLRARIHYILHSTQGFSFTELIFPLQGIHQMSITASLSVFSRTNHKDRYAVLVAYLRAEADVFAQIVYLSCIVYVNRAILWPGHRLFAEDDVAFFCFSTFPATFHFFLTRHDQLQGIDLIEQLFAFHFMISGANFLKHHRFLWFLVSSFSLTVNPGAAFEVIAPVMRPQLVWAEEIYGVYEAVNDSAIVRRKYWDRCVECAGALIGELRKVIPLIPAPIRYLAYRFSQLESKSSVFLKYCAFDAIFLNYVESFFMTGYRVILRDVCNVIRCAYPRRYYRNPLMSFLEKHSSLETFGIVDFWNEIQINELEEDPLSQGIASCEPMSLFSPRDLGLLFHSVDLFLRYGNGAGAAHLVVKFAGLSAPETEGSDKILALRSWGVVPVGPEPIPPAPHGFTELFAALATLNSTELHCSDVCALASAALLYGGLFLSGAERVKLANLPASFHELPAALKASSSHAIVVEKFLHTICDSLFHIGLEVERTRSQSCHLIDFLIHEHFLDALHATYPLEFAIDGFTTASPRELLAQILKSIESRIPPLQLPPAHASILERLIILAHIDELEGQVNGQCLTWTDHMQTTFSALSQEMLGRDFPPFASVIGRVRANLARIRSDRRPSANLRLAMAAMALLPNVEPNALKGIIASAENPAIFGFLAFIRPFATGRLVVPKLFGDTGLLPIQILVMAGNDLQEEIEGTTRRSLIR